MLSSDRVNPKDVLPLRHIELGRYAIDEWSSRASLRVVPSRSVVRMRTMRLMMQGTFLLALGIVALASKPLWSFALCLLSTITSVVLWPKIAEHRCFDGNACCTVRESIELSRDEGVSGYRGMTLTGAVLVDHCDVGQVLSISQVGVDVFLCTERFTFHLDRFENGWQAAGFADLIARLVDERSRVQVSLAGVAERESADGSQTRGTPWGHARARRAAMEEVRLDPALPSRIELLGGLVLAQCALFGMATFVNAGPRAMGLAGVAFLACDAVYLDFLVIRAARTRVAAQVQRHLRDAAPLTER